MEPAGIYRKHATGVRQCARKIPNSADLPSLGASLSWVVETAYKFRRKSGAISDQPEKEVREHSNRYHSDQTNLEQHQTRQTAIRKDGLDTWRHFSDGIRQSLSGRSARSL